jgi:hypothetical protein
MSVGGTRKPLCKALALECEVIDLIGRTMEQNSIDWGTVTWFRESFSNHVVRKKGDGKKVPLVSQNVKSDGAYP